MVIMDKIRKLLGIKSPSEDFVIRSGGYPSRCYICSNWKTTRCPNSSKCMALASKPYFKEK